MGREPWLWEQIRQRSLALLVLVANDSIEARPFGTVRADRRLLLLRDRKDGILGTGLLGLQLGLGSG